MNRETAVKIIKQLFTQCNRIEGKSIKLMPQNAGNLQSEGCQIHIQTINDDLFCGCQKVATQNGLAIAQENAVLIIYEPPAEH
jgi:hypothetical protein